MNLDNFLKKIKLNIFSYINNVAHIKTSKLVIILGIIFLIIFIRLIYWINPNLDIFIHPEKNIFDISSIVLVYFSVLIAIAALFNSSEMAIWGIKYEKSKNSAIRLFNIVRYVSPIFSPKNKLKLLKYLLDDTFYDKEFEDFLIRWKYVPMKKEGIVEEDMYLLDNLVIFKRDYELYYLPEKLLAELICILYSKNELNDEEIVEVLDVIKRHVKKEFDIKL